MDTPICSPGCWAPCKLVAATIGALADVAFQAELPSLCQYPTVSSLPRRFCSPMSNSSLDRFYRVGGDTRVAGFLLALATAALLFIGTGPIAYIRKLSRLTALLHADLC